MKNTNKAFTLVELIVVITILAILGTIAFISLQGYSQDAKNSKVVSDTRTIVTAIETKLTEGKITMAGVVDNTNDLTDTAKNWVSGKFATGSTLGTDGTYKVGKVNFVGLRQNGADFKDNDSNEYVAAVAIDGSDYSFYQVAGQMKNADGTFEAVVKGNYVKTVGATAEGLISATASSTGALNGTTITTLY